MYAKLQKKISPVSGGVEQLFVSPTKGRIGTIVLSHVYEKSALENKMIFLTSSFTFLLKQATFSLGGIASEKCCSISFSLTFFYVFLSNITDFHKEWIITLSLMLNVRCNKAK